jgi:hypothetical protein
MWDSIVVGASSVLDRPWTFGTIELTLGHVVAFVVTLWIAVFVSRILTTLLEEDLFSVLKLRRGVGATTPGATGTSTTTRSCSIAPAGTKSLWRFRKRRTRDWVGRRPRGSGWRW